MKKTRTRLLIVDHEIKTFLMHRLELAEAIAKSGIDVHVALPREPGIEVVVNKHFTVHNYYLERLGTRVWDEIRCFISLHNLYKRVNPQIIHHFGLKPVLYGGSAARTANIKAVVNTLTGLGYLFSADTLKYRILRRIVSLGLNVSFFHPNNRITIQNADDCLSLITNKIPVAKSAILVKGSGVNTSTFTQSPETYGIPVVLMASRLLWEKGVREFVEAAKILHNSKTKIRFLLAGEPDYSHPSSVPLSYLNMSHLKGYIKWIGWRDDMPQLLKHCHIVCLPSYYGEGIPRILLEAAAAGRAIITTDSLGCRDIVQHEHNGLIVAPKSAEMLANAINRLIEDPRLRSLLGNRARNTVLGEYSSDQIIQGYVNIYETLIKSTN